MEQVSADPQFWEVAEFKLATNSTTTVKVLKAIIIATLLLQLVFEKQTADL